MKNLIIKIIELLSRSVQYSTVERASYYRNKLYSIWIGRYFKQTSGQFFTRPLYCKGAQYISLGKNFYAGPRFRIEAWDHYRGKDYQPEIIIGNNVSFNFNCHVGAINKIVIRDNVLIGSNVFITDHSHGRNTLDEAKIPPAQRPLYSKGEVFIDENVWICENVSILPGVSIGKGSIIAANSVVTQNIPEYVIAAGSPARIIKVLQ
jgi:acetyltransferase-like isoleucine patch superfamily enzyme